MAGRRHINLGELDAALAAEIKVGKRKPGSFYVHLQDSQVSLAAMIKGRSSSTEINKRLRASIPDQVHYKVRGFYGFVASALNPADDPTRSRAVRGPSKAPAQWLSDMMEGDFSALDVFLQEHGLDPASTSGLPPEEELSVRVPLDLRSSRAVRAERRKRVGSLSRRGKSEAETTTSLEGGPPLKAETPGKDTAVFEAETHASSIEGPAQEAETPSVRPAELGADGRGLSEEQIVEVLKACSRSQFQFNSKFGSLEEAMKAGKGVLELYAGVRGFSKAAVRYGFCWSLSYDIKHSCSEDLSLAPLQQQLLDWIDLGFFLAMGAGPVCASFSTAITPPCRTAEFPEGVPWCSAKQRLKNEAGNEQLAFVLKVVQACIRNGVLFWVENPDGSWMEAERTFVMG